MEINVHIPERGSTLFTLYAKGYIEKKTTLPDEGTLISFHNVVVLYYKYSYHRRAYIVRHIQETSHIKAVFLPNVKEAVGIIYYAHGRKIDLLRTALYNLEQISQKKVYQLPTIFWQKLSCLIDDYDGYKCKAIKSNLICLYEQYKEFLHDKNI